MAKKAKTGINRDVELSDELAEFMGADYASRAAITKEIWKHIKKYDLNEGRTIYPDEVLSPILGKKALTMFEIPKMVSKHIIGR